MDSEASHKPWPSSTTCAAQVAWASPSTSVNVGLGGREEGLSVSGFAGVKLDVDAWKELLKDFCGEGLSRRCRISSRRCSWILAMRWACSCTRDLAACSAGD